MNSENRADQVFCCLMKEIYSRGGYVPLAELADLLKLERERALEFFQDYPKYFKICYEGDTTSNDKNTFVLGVTEAIFCDKYASNPNSCIGCDGLHVCKFFSLGDSCKFGDDCRFVHSFKRSTHNQRILSKYHLLLLDELELKCLFQKIENRCEVTKPTYCKYFNNSSCEKRHCMYLHICQYYLKNMCRFGKKCKINHDFTSNDFKILESYGIVTSSISDALSKLRILYKVEENESTNEERSEIICLHYLSSNDCKFGENCRHQHKEMPYQWRYKAKHALSDDNSWQEFSPLWNEEIEKKFCNLEDETHITNEKKSSVNVQFSKMECVIAKQKYTLQRLSTPSYISSARSPLTTTWIWYWKGNDDIWIEYGSSTARSIDVTNEDIEKTYLKKPMDMMVIMRQDTKKEIRIDFREMIQNGNRTREIIRRPKFISSKEAQTLRIQALVTSKNVKPTNLPLNSSHFNILLLDKENKEYECVSNKFYHSMKESSIVTIERIENGNLWEDYEWKKKKMLKEMPQLKDITDELLFHGTTFDSVQGICKQGFDVRLSGSAVGLKYGKGIYFSKNSALAHNYTIPFDGEYKILLAKVLPGEFVKGKPSYARPPPKNCDEKDGKLYDSCVDDVSEPKLHVIFANEQTYPAYIITYNLTN